MRPGGITVGFAPANPSQFIQVRAPYEDPNLVQFWIQAKMGVRIDTWHPKAFATNGLAVEPAGMTLLGDYVS